jgi:hypothetical protein
LSRFNNDPGRQHWSAVKRVLRYLRGTSKQKLVYSKNGSVEITGSSDADWAANKDDRRSVTGFVFDLQGGAISWASKRQPTVALSSNEAEYMALAAATQEAMWWKGFANEIEGVHGTMKIQCDNQSAIYSSKNSSYSPRSRHIDIRHHFVREKVADESIEVSFVPTEEQVADGMTKAVCNVKNQTHKKKMGLEI